MLEVTWPRFGKLDVVQVGRRDGPIEPGYIGHQTSDDPGEHGQSGEGSGQLYDTISHGFLGDWDHFNLHADGLCGLLPSLQDLLSWR